MLLLIIIEVVVEESCHSMQTEQDTIEAEQQEVLGILLANAVHRPDAVMVHLQYATVAPAAVVNLLILHDTASLTFTFILRSTWSLGINIPWITKSRLQMTNRSQNGNWYSDTNNVKVLKGVEDAVPPIESIHGDERKYPDEGLVNECCEDFETAVDPWFL